MRGHEPVIAMRMAGVMPQSVTFSTDPVKADITRHWPEFTSHAHVEVEATDPIARLDLRFVVGMPLVFIDGQDAQRVDALYRACLEAGASRVIATTMQPQPWGLEAQTMTDNKDTFTWQA